MSISCSSTIGIDVLSVIFFSYMMRLRNYLIHIIEIRVAGNYQKGEEDL